VTSQVAVFVTPSTVMDAVIVAVPSPSAEITPAVTSATDELDVVHVTVADAGTVVAVRVSVSPISMDA
jgi:hypothetical protein